jgi:dimethylamine monooxygenase subunit A
LKYFPFTTEDYRLQIGLKSLDLKEWVEIDEHWETTLARKKQLLKEHHDVCLQALAPCESGAFELHQLLAEHLSQHFPDKYVWQNNQMTVLGESYSAPQTFTEALEQIALWTQEDWAILSAKPPVVLEGACICFPSRWSLKDKIGRDTFAIHAPVPKFDTIARPAQGFLERVSADKPMWRLNWTLHDSDELFCPKPHPSSPDLSLKNILGRTWVRIERQTLRRLPTTQAVVFSIRTYIHPVQEIIQDPAQKQLFAATLAGLPPDTASYKGMGAFHSLLNEALNCT